jgi:aquaporin Z
MSRQSGGDHRCAAVWPSAAGRGRWLAQFVGGILGALLLWGMFNTSPLYSTSRTGLGTNGWGAASDIHIGAGGAFLAEVVLTALFVFVILGVTSRLGNAATAAMTIGLTLSVVHLVGIPIDGTSVNPARSLGPALIVGGTALTQVWLFIVAPLVGGIVAAGLHWLVYPRPRSEPAPGSDALAAEPPAEAPAA